MIDCGRVVRRASRGKPGTATAGSQSDGGFGTPGAPERRTARGVAPSEPKTGGVSRSSKRQATPLARRERKKKRKKPGRPEGHPGSYRTRPDPIDREVRAPLRRCPRCAGPVLGDREHEQFVIDLPAVRAHVSRIMTQSGWCKACRCRVHSTHPEQVSQAFGAASVALGPRAMGLAADLKHQLGVPYGDVTKLLSAYFGLRVTWSALVQSSVRLAAKGRASYEALKGAIRGCRSHRRHGMADRLQVGLVVGLRDLLYEIAPGRGQNVVTTLLGDDYSGIVVSDGLPALDSLPYRRAQCLARRARDLSLEQTRGAVRFPLAIRRWLGEVFELVGRRANIRSSAG